MIENTSVLYNYQHLGQFVYPDLSVFSSADLTKCNIGLRQKHRVTFQQKQSSVSLIAQLQRIQTDALETCTEERSCKYSQPQSNVTE